jgi:hypothetical protein
MNPLSVHQVTVAAVVLVLAFCLPVGGADEPAAEGTWTPLFDGESTAGWTPRVEGATFEAVDGELHLVSTKNVWVTSDVELANFVFEAEVLAPEDAETAGFNSGLAFRCFGATGKPKGYQCEIDGPFPGETGGVYGIGLGGWLYPTKDSKAEHRERILSALKRGEWNHYRIRCEGKRIRIWVNDTLISDLEDEQSLRGFFGIQHHGKGGTVRFRNLQVRDLGETDEATDAEAAAAKAP